MKLLEWFTFARLIFYYVVSLPIMVMGGFMTFYFPIYPIFAAAGWEFSNLGPIATAIWGYVLWLYVVTPLFFVALVAKLISRFGASKNRLSS